MIKIIDKCIKTGEGFQLTIPYTNFSFEIKTRVVPEPEGPRPDKPLTWKSCKASMSYDVWFQARAVQRIMIENWLTEKAKNIEERKTVKKLVKIKKMVNRSC